MLHLTVIAESAITAALDQAIRDALCECFPVDQPVFARTRQWHGTGPAWSIVIESSGVVAAHVGIVDRTVTAGGVPVRAAGIQNVIVRPAFRCQGLAKQVMDKAMSEAGQRGFDSGLLFCIPALEKLYAASGWRVLPKENIIRVDELGREVPLPDKNIAMAFPLARPDFPPGPIHLQGNDW